MTSTISEDALRSQQSRIMKAMRAATQPQQGSDLRDIASALTTQNQGGANYFDTMKKFGQEQAQTAMNAEMGIYEQMKEQVARGDAEAKSVDDAINEVAGNDPKIYASVLEALHSDPEPVNSRNAKSKVMKYAAELGINPLSVQEAKAKIAKTAADTIKTSRENSGLDVGATGNIIKQIAKEKGLSFSDAAYLYQTGFRGGTQYDENGNIITIKGAPEAKGRIKEGEKTGELNATAKSDLKKKGVQANNVLGLIDEAKLILPNSSSGLVATGATKTAGLAGKSTAASRADAKLKVIGASLVSNVPRMEGPQSNYDVQLYREAASDVANTLIPYEDRLAALETMRALNQKYTQEQIPDGGTVTPKRVKFDDLPE